MAKKKWKMPAWMEPLRDDIQNTGGNPVEELMNDTETHYGNNAVRTALIVAVSSQVALLYRLHEAGRLVGRDLAADRKRAGQSWGEQCAGALPPKKKRGGLTTCDMK